ncbi:MAG: VTT domain-containing protein [Candidatus Microsaccharimonas sp.]
MFETLLSSVSLLGAIPGLDLVDLIIGLGIFAVIFVIFAESGLLIGFFLPGDSLLFTAGALYATGILPGNVPINIHVFVLLLFAAAVLGDTVGYWFGRKAGPRIFRKPDAKVFKQAHIQNAQKFYEKHGGKTIIMARFVPIIRTFAPIVAGAGKMDYTRFLSFNLIGGFLWTFGITYLGYFAGKALIAAGIDIDTVILPIIFLIVFISILPPTIHILKDKNNRAAIWNGTKKQFQFLIGKFKK